MARAKKSKSDVSQEEMGQLIRPGFPKKDKLTFNRGLQDVEAGLRRSDGELQGRRGLVMFCCYLVRFPVSPVVSLHVYHNHMHQTCVIVPSCAMRSLRMSNV